MATLASLIISISADVSKFVQGVQTVSGKAAEMGSKVLKAGVATGAALGGVAVAAGKMAANFEGDMANVGTLLGKEGGERVAELGDDVKRLSQQTGKPLKDLSGGLYQVVSAFGDSADAAKILEISAKASSAGLATTENAVNLLSAVTKGYGDTSAAAVEKASDLAFQTVKLGQTTFPELAASMGRVVPLAAELGVKQEELFGVMSTATGVTGNAAEVSTQLRGVLQGLMAPTESMSGLFEKMGVKSGKALLEQKGLQGAIDAIIGTAKATGEPLQKYLGSIEGQTLALSLAGSQAGNFTEKTKAMAQTAGATSEAFDIQQKSVNASMDRLKQGFSVVMVNLGEKFLPMLNSLAKWVQDHMPEIQAVMSRAFEVGGQAMTFVGQEIIPRLIAAFAFFKDEVLPRIVAAFEFVKKNFDVIGPALAAVALTIIVPAFIAWAITAGTAAAATIAALLPVLLPIAAVGLAVAGLAYVWRRWGGDITRITKEVIGTVVGWWIWFKTETIAKWGEIKTWFLETLSKIASWFSEKWSSIKAAVTGWWEKIRDAAAGAWDTIVSGFWTLWDNIKGWFAERVAGAKDWGRDLMSSFLDGITEWFGRIRERLSGFWSSLKPSFGSPNLDELNLPAQGFAQGGMVPGPMGAPQMAVVHGGERILTPAQQRGGGGLSISVVLQGPVYGVLDLDRRITQVVRDAIQGGAFRGVIATP